MIRPTRIKLAAGNDSLAIQWSDGHESRYPYAYLRRKCPCATCGGAAPIAHTAAGSLPILGQEPLRPLSAELAGRYALQIHWSDRHASGIYSFEYLRAICPCTECLRQAPPGSSSPGS